MKHTAIAALLALGLATPTLADELSVATFVPPQHHTNTVMFKWFGDELAKRTNGELTIKIYPAGQLGAGPVQQYKRVVEGVADIVFGVAGYTPELFPKTMLVIPPGKATNSLEITERIRDVFDEHLADEWSEVKVLAMSAPAGVAIAATQDLSTMEGWSGAKIVPFSTMTTPVIEAMGAVPVQMPVTEMYTGLSTGTIDAAYATYNNMTPPWNFSDVSTFFVEGAPVQFQPVFVAMNMERYLGLSDEHRAVIDELAGEAFYEVAGKSFHGADELSLELMKEHTDKDYKRVTVSAEERAKMDAAVAAGMEAVFADYEKRGIANAREIYKAINK